jgi:hypothetical protein
MAQAMFELALKQPGCLGAESVRDISGLGIAVAYFTDERSRMEAEFGAPGRPNASARSAGIPIMSCG